MTAPDRDDEFEAFLKRRTLLPNTDDRLEPPSALDELVLKKARAAIRGQEVSGQGQEAPLRPARWATPVALAATILLSLSIVLNVTLNTNRPVINPQRQEERAKATDDLAQAPSSGAGVASGKLTPSTSAPAAAAAPAAAPAQTLADAPTPSASAPAVAPPQSAPTPAAAPSEVASETASDAASTSRARSNLREEATEADMPQRALAKRKADIAAVPPPAAPAPLSGAPAPVSAAPGPSSAAQAPLATQARSETTQAPAQDEKAHPQDAKAWLRKIAALRAEGKTAQADAEMQRFRDSFPTYRAEPLPPASSEPR